MCYDCTKVKDPKWHGVFAKGPDQTLFPPHFSKAVNVASSNLPNLHAQVFVLPWFSHSNSNTKDVFLPVTEGN